MALIAFNRIGHRILAVVGLTVTLGLGGIAWFYVAYQERAVLAQNERNMLRLTEAVSLNLQSVMLAGYADIAQSFADRLHQVEGVTDFHILRANGTEAFGDNRTIRAVNQRRGEELFRLREQEVERRMLEPDNPQLQRALQGRAPAVAYGVDEHGERTLRIVAPVLNQPSCHKCHGSAQPVRGVILLAASLEMVERDIYETRKASILVLAPTLLATLLLTGLIMRRSVVRPIERMTSAMRRASAGELVQRVPVEGEDELAQMAGSFNTMTNELLKTYRGLQLEQDKLTTIILGAREAIIVTDAADHVVLVNPAATRLLGKSQERIVADGFLQLFDRPELMAQLLADPAADKEPHTLEYNAHVLSVHAARIHDAQGKRVGSAALLRDVTEEKRLEDELRRQSNTDSLTLLFNRRYLDESLQTELDRAQRYHLPLSVLVMDVDHFKRFNDTHGHEMGDRVLQAVARVLRAALRSQDLPCRYGGEEFVAILPSTNKAGAYALAERLRQDIERLSVDGLQVTASIGVAEFPDIEVTQQARLIGAADAAMYQAKRSGRNRVCIAHSVALEQGN